MAIYKIKITAFRLAVAENRGVTYLYYKTLPSLYALSSLSMLSLPSYVLSYNYPNNSYPVAYPQAQVDDAMVSFQYI